MSLARNLMSSVSESVDVSGYDYSGCAIAESTWVDSACESLISDIYKVDKAYHTADIIGQVQVMQEGANPEVLLEGIVKSGIEKIKEAFRKFWAKLKEWFKKVKDYFKAMFLTGSKFVKEFKKAIQDKKADGFKYTAFKYTLDSGEGEAVFDEVTGKIKELVGVMDKVITIRVEKDQNSVMAGVPRYAQNEDGVDAKPGKVWVNSSKTKTEKRSYEDFDNTALNRSLKKDIGELSASEFQDDFIKKLGKKSDDITELTDYLKATFRDGDDEESEWEDFESNSKEDMMSLIENGGKAISDIERAEKKFENAINSIIKAYDKVKSTDKSGEAGYKAAQKISGYLSALLAVGKVPSTTKVDAYKEAMASYERILKSFLRWKPVKEGYEGYGSMEPATESLLDAAYRLI